MSDPLPVKQIFDLLNNDVDFHDKIPGKQSTYYDVLYEYYFDDMPYGVKKARTGDPDEWIMNRLYSDYWCD